MTTWSCLQCTLINKKASPFCTACGSQNPTLAAKEKKSIIPKAFSKQITGLSNALSDIFTYPSTSAPPHQVVRIRSAPYPQQPPPRPPPPGANGSALHYDVTWQCRNCFASNSLSNALCGHCGLGRMPDHRKKTSNSNEVDHFDTSLCAEITVEVEKRDREGAQTQYDSILAFCQQNNITFIDDSFPHSAKSIGDLRRDDDREEAVNGVIPTSFIWLRPSQIFTRDGRSFQWTIFNDPRPSDIEQGALGDCWLMSALALIAERPDILEHILLNKTFNAFGIYQVRLCVDGEWKVVFVDDFLPCRSESRSIAFATGRKNQLWVPLIEKALAKQLGGYARLRSGRTLEGLSLLTGAPVEVISLEDEPNKDVIWARLLSATDASFVMGSSCGAGQREANSEEYKKVGLLSRHAYSILTVIQHEQNRLLRVRNPWGTFVWKGDWSDNWPGWPKDLKERLNKRYKAETGAFWISFDDFLRYFDSVELAKVRMQQGWRELRIPTQVGGAYNNNDKAVRIIVEHPTEVCLTLFQTEARKAANLVDLMICVHQLTPMGTIGELVCRTPRKTEAFVTTGDVILLAGEYIVVTHSMHTLGGRKIRANLVVHSSRLLYADTLVCTAQLYVDSLVSLALKEGHTHSSVEGVIPRYLTKNFGGLMLMVENTHENMFVSVRVDCDGSTNVLSSRSAMLLEDVVSPLSRQMRLSRRPTLQTDSCHSPPLPDYTSQQLHAVIPLFN